MDFSQEELFDACDRLIAGLLERAGMIEPPVDALRMAEDHLGIPVEYAEPEEDERGRPMPGRSRSGIVVTSAMSSEQQQVAAANGIARMLFPLLLNKLGIVPGNETKQASTHFRSLLVSRLLVPSRMLRSALRTCKFEVPALKGLFATAPYEMVALRLLDLDDPCIIAIVDDGVVATRRGNSSAVSKKLTVPEQNCLNEVMEQDLPHKLRGEGWTVQGWPVPDRPFRRVLLRAVPDDI